VLRKYCRVDIYIEEGLTLVPRGSEEVQISNGAAIKVNRDKIIATMEEERVIPDCYFI
jgi:hypothetical protein